MSVLFQQELDVIRNVDVVVVGAGPAGLAAAVAAARNGAKTLVFDCAGCIGGMATGGLVAPFMTSYDSTGQQMVVRGIFEELVNRMAEIGGAIHPGEVHAGGSHASYLRIGHNNVGPFKADAFKLMGMRMLREAGAELLLHTQFVQVLREGDKLTGVIVAGKEGLGVIRAKAVIDCSGDADVAARAGVPFVIGDRESGNIQPASLFFRVGNVDTARVTENMNAHWGEIRPFFGPFSWLLKQYSEDWGDFPRAEICVFEEVDPGVFRVNCSRILDVDATRTGDLTRATEIGQEQCQFVFNFLKKHAPGFENAVLLATADTIGIRETRHIQGEHMDELQQTLLKDDCYIPGFANHDPADLCLGAEVTAASHKPGFEPEKVINGVARRVGEQENAWESEDLETAVLTLRLKEPSPVCQLRLTFDPNLTRELMPSMTRNVRDRQVRGLPPELVRDYRVELLRDQTAVWSRDISGNSQRLNVLELDAPVLCDSLRITVRATYGAPTARIFEVRAY